MLDMWSSQQGAGASWKWLSGQRDLVLQYEMESYMTRGKINEQIDDVFQGLECSGVHDYKTAYVSVSHFPSLHQIQKHLSCEQVVLDMHYHDSVC